MKILAIGGSIRKGSFSRALMEAAAGLAPEGVEVETFNAFAEIPMFNADLEQEQPEPVKALKAKIRAADALLFVTPEYNYSIPGYLKNTIDWASRPYVDNSWNDKPAAIISSSNGMLAGVKAQMALRQIGGTLNIHFLNRPEVLVPMVQEKLTDGKLTDEHTKEKITALMQALVDWTNRLSK